MDDPCDPFFWAGWQSDLHKMIGFATAYGGKKATHIGDPCDDWSGSPFPWQRKNR